MFDIIGLCNPIMDILVKIPEDLLETLGLQKNTMNIVQIDRQSIIFEYIKDKPKVYMPGGSGANTMVIMAELGSKSAFSGTVGKDNEGALFKQYMQTNEATPLLNFNQGATGRTIILITPDASRTMNTYLGVCQEYKPENVPVEAIRQARMLYVTGYMWDTDTQKDAVLLALEEAKNAQTQVVFNLSDSMCVERHHEQFLSLIEQYVDIALMNEDEALQMVGAQNFEQAVAELSQLTEHFVITLGKNGAYVQDQEAHFIPAQKTQVVDTTGAGDAFAAGYLHALLQHQPAKIAGHLGCKMAAKVVSHYGLRGEDSFESQTISSTTPLSDKQTIINF